MIHDFLLRLMIVEADEYPTVTRVMMVGIHQCGVMMVAQNANLG